MAKQKNKFAQILLLLLLSQLTLQCQMQQKVPEFHVEISQPNDKYEITPVFDYIKTLEGTSASLPYGSTSGSWGSSGKGWTEQHGTPIGFEITYYAPYEGKFYYINQDFDLTQIKDMTNRCYAGSDENSASEVKNFISLDDWQKLNDKDPWDHSYDQFASLVFGFAPQGMVMVWLRYGGANCIELGRYQAKEVTDAKRIEECKQKYVSTYRLEGNRFEEEQAEMKIENALNKTWDDYRIKYNWNYEVTSDNKNFKLFQFDTQYFNGEKEAMFRPLVQNPAKKKRAVPEIINIYFETSAKERYIARAYFDWDKMNELLKNAGENATLQFHVNDHSYDVKVMLNNQIVKTDSTIRVYPDSHMRYRESYK